MSIVAFFYRQRVMRVGDSLVFIEPEKAIVWGHVFSEGGTFQWDKKAKSLTYSFGERVLSKKLVFNPLQTLSPDGAPRTPWYKWPLIVFFLVILPAALMVPAFERATELFASLGGPPVANLHHSPPHAGAIIVKPDNSWMK